MAKPEKYALVTGASSGIGWHISLELAERGYHIIGVSNQPEKLELLKSVIGKSYEKECFTLNTDLAVPGAANLVFTLCEEQKESSSYRVFVSGTNRLKENTTP